MDENDDKPSSTDDEQSKSGYKFPKMVIFVFVVVVAVVGVTGAFLMHMNNYANTGSIATSSNNTSTSVNETQPVVYQATWHNVTSFSGSRGTQRTFDIKGERFKIVMSATPYTNYRTNAMKVEINGPSGNSNVLGAGELNWNNREGVKNKQITVEVTGTPGTYTAKVISNYLKMWTVTVYDYY